MGGKTSKEITKKSIIKRVSHTFAEQYSQLYIHNKFFMMLDFSFR